MLCVYDTSNTEQQKQTLLSQCIPARAHTSWYGADDTIKIKHVRELQQASSYSAQANQPHVMVLHNIDAASLPAQNALLKLVEEPPPHVYLVLTATKRSDVLPTLQSRCITHTIAIDTSQKKDNGAPATTLYQDIMQSSHGQLVLLAAQYKERDAARTVVNDLLSYVVHQLEKTTGETKQLIKQSQALDAACSKLDANTNVLLTLESCFFSMIDAP